MSALAFVASVVSLSLSAADMPRTGNTDAPATSLYSQSAGQIIASTIADSVGFAGEAVHRACLWRKA